MSFRDWLRGFLLGGVPADLRALRAGQEQVRAQLDQIERKSDKILARLPEPRYDLQFNVGPVSEQES